MTRSANRSIEKILGIEGGYIDHPDDTGGKTRFGITEKLAKEYNYQGDMKDLPVEKAKEIYLKEFWEGNCLDEIAQLYEPVAFEVFDTAVNAGSKVAATFLQRALNAFNKDEEYYDDLKVDGFIGPKTITAFSSFHSKRRAEGCKVLLKALNGLQASYYVRLAEQNPRYESFVYGWINKRVD